MIAKAYINICTVCRYVGERQLTWIRTPQKMSLLLKSSSDSVSQLFARKASGLHTAGEWGVILIILTLFNPAYFGISGTRGGAYCAPPKYLWVGEG